MFPVLVSRLWVLRANSIQPSLRLQFLSDGRASTNHICKLRIHDFKAANGQEQNYEAVRPNYEKAFDRSQSHISKLRIRSSQLRADIFRLPLEVLNLDFQTTNGPKF